MTVLHLLKFFAAREDFIALVERASKPATPTFLSALRPRTHLVAAPPLCITPLQILRSARRFCRNPSPGGASDSSPVREHWERRERQASPGTGRKNWRRVLLSPRAGAGKFAIRTQGSRPGLFSFALRASGTFVWLRLAALWGGQSWPQPPLGGSWPGLQTPHSWRKIVKEDVTV